MNEVDSDLIKVTLALKQNSISALEELTLRISDPDSPLYRKHLSIEDIRKIIGISETEFKILKMWLEGKLGAKNTVLLPSGDAVSTMIPKYMAQMLYNDIHYHTKFLGDKYSSVMDIIEIVLSKDISTKKVSQPRSIRTYVKNPQATEATPNLQKQQVYKMDINLKGSNSSNVQMVWGPGTFGVSKKDISKFYQDYSITVASPDNVYITQYPGTPGGDNWGEGTLDTTYITSFGGGITTLVVNSNTSESTEEGNGFGYAFLAEIISLNQLSLTKSTFLLSEYPTIPSLPLVLSLSLGSLSWDSCDFMCKTLSQQGTYTYQQCADYLQTQRQVCMYDSSQQADRLNTELMKLTSRGVTILAATGDGGSHFSFEPFRPDGGIGDALNKISCQYNFPTFPAASPWVTGVGGIDLGSNPSAPFAWAGSGSGFSWRFPMPQYQFATVQNYLSQYNTTTNFPKANSYNSSNRAYPDVSAVSNNVPLIVDGSWFNAGGTSASTPTFGGIISLINDFRLNSGKPPLGFINPAIYKFAQQYPGELFQDISSGNSRTSCTEGFPATPGWDPVTGWGSPIFSGLLKYLGN